MSSLNPLTMPLSGLQMIEASAGTGKTFTLAALYVRLVLGHGRGGEEGAGTDADGALYPPQILVMTFTDAATSELRGRVRQRLAQAARYFKELETDAAVDDFLHELRQDYPVPQWPACAQRLDMAAQWMDDAAIFTIHGWSSRMLKTHAFDSASLFQQSRVEDSGKLRLGAVQDYWRRWFYAIPLAQLGALRALGNTPDELLKNLKPLWDASDRAPGDAPPAGSDAHVLLQQWEVWQAGFVGLEAAARSACTPELIALLDATIAAKRLKGYRKDGPGKLADWAQGESILLLNKAARSTAQNLLQRFGVSTLLNLGWSQAADHAAFGHIQALADHLQAEPDVGAELLQHAATETAQAYRTAKNQLAQFDFSDLLQCLYVALQSPDGRLAAAIRQQFPVALVDEFQDTDPWQYGALSKIYGQAVGTGLIMIGDPKQAIYSFRGADLATYLEARHQAHAIHTLSGNFRSTAPLVAAVNHVFGSAQRPFGEVLFDTVLARNAKVLPLQVQGAEQTALTVWQLAQARPARKDVFQREMAALFATQIVRLLNARAAAPGEMAVLVRSGDQARAVRQALSERGVRSVYLSERDSVYATQEALDLWRMLGAVANPRSTSLVRAALSTRLWGLGFDALEALFQDEETWDSLVEKFHAWQVVWQRQGFLPMLHHLLHDQSIPSRLLNPPDGAAQDGERRLTNLMHLGDLLQTASASLQGEAALIRHLEQQLQNPKSSGDAAQLRLESDADLVQVVTIHKSKGLQYPLVFLPFVSSFMAESKDSGRDDAERLAEDIRLLYVAMTRAERALWLGVAQVKGDLDGLAPKLRGAVSQLLQRESADDLSERLKLWGTCQEILVAAAPPPDDTLYLAQAIAKRWKPALLPVRSLDSRWWTASFSALTRELGPASVVATMPGSEREDRLDDAQVDSATPLALDVSETQGADAEPPAFNAFPAGSSYGTLLHDLLEWQFERDWPLAQTPPALSREWTTLLQRKAQRLKLDEAQSAQLQDWLQHIVTTPLPLPGAPDLLLGGLSRLNLANAWAEMAFTFPVHGLGASRLDALIQQHALPGQARSPLQPLQLEGMLIGFMDLVLEHDGRYFVLDYKSNRLDFYVPEQLRGAILAHRYDVQYSLYTLALHRLLKSRLQDYDYDRDVGGAIYLFLRGIDQEGAGVFIDRPPRALIEALDAAFAQPAKTSEVQP